MSEQSSVRLFRENQTVRMKFCQIILWNSYCESEVLPVNLWMPCCTNVVLSGKLFRIKKYLRLNSTFVSLLCNSKTNQLGFSLQLLKVLPSSAYHLGMPYKRWAVLLFMPLWPSRTWVRITCFFSTRVYILVCTRSCSACRLHPFAICLGWTQLGSGH